MVYPFRRAGEKLKTVAKMDTWARGQSEEQTTATKPSTRCYLLELPTELLLEIISHLSVIPETCLALTCKRLFAISGAIFRSVRFSQDFAPLFHHYRNGHNFVTTRWQLINILENSRWSACSKCLKLHPRDAFSSRELRRKPEDRVCLLGDFAGIVDLCPCKKLTFRDKMDLVELLKVRQRSVAALQSQFGARIQQRFCWHSCTKDYGPTQLHIEIYPELDDQDQLKIKTEYRLTTESGKLGKEEYITPRFGCAHRSVDLWLSSVCQTTICQSFDSICASCKRISICNSCNSVLKCPRRQPSRVDQDSGRVTYHFWTERCLGGTISTPDQTWASQRIHPAENSVEVDNCSDVCPWTVREHPPSTGPPALGMDILGPAVQDQSMSQLYTSINLI
ncbi:uncharacterized protein P174DRAFT_366739 [Aspergillus novofumigatus IBT 16806]|uniref:F-box domain-containing protein n=1 Tax=Aspergillus novofumigatus (strain IBT 16806) TaxID=1392255 RepID=A0A2I1CDX3_ASPN1|nr:uncharacterized protein P174DRAFT_366739 [Aspergillus novofumigatus IBT 16806]PKX95834.1 hypothetical protein P174DRAFT_366739 [Aspergillus novofumigatus IBT 16806]